MKNLYKALADFQSECPIIFKDTQGYSYTYADMPQIIKVIMPLLKRHKLGFAQPLFEDGIKTIIFHYESGETLESFTHVPRVELAKMNPYQAYGSGITYYRRYALASILGLVTDKDTDAAGQIVEPKKEEKVGEDWIKMLQSVEKLEDLIVIYKENKALVDGNAELKKEFSKNKKRLEAALS